MVAGEPFDHILEPRRIAQGDDMTRALAVQRIAVPVAHRPARALDDRHERGEVVKLQSRLDHQVDMAVREQAVLIAVAAEEHSLVRRRSEEHTSELQSLMRISY